MPEQLDLYILSLKKDAAIAGLLAESLRRYRLPSRVALPDPGLDYRRIFVDTDEAPLDAQARNRLEHARFLALLCSPGTRDHPNVMAKLDYFRQLHGGEGIIPAMAEGEPTDTFPQSFYQEKRVQQILPDMTVVERVDRIEPVAADLRLSGERPSRRREMLRYETVRVAALLLNLHPDALEQRQRQRNRHRVAAALTAVGAASLAAAGIFLRLGLIARNEGAIAEEQTRLSVEIAQRTIADLPEEFAGNDLALLFVDEAARNARASLDEIGLGGLLDVDVEAEAEAEGGG